MDNPEPEGESVNTLVFPFLDSDDDSDDGEVLSELEEYGSAGRFRRTKIINSYDGDDLAFQYTIGFIKFVAYSDPFLQMNIIMRKAYYTIMVNGLESMGMNLVAIIRDVCVFIGSFTFVTDFLEEIHATLAHLEKKRTRLRLYTKFLEETIIQTVETASPTIATTSEIDQDGIRIITTASKCSRLK
uniref:Uncharacterized protein n=1 Tax=Tanacetum cinerariifolium TaxID=118510 RepID=A0A6L2M2Y4_TANCI|nr:hypothetical protein [Tanacetum cinerariifolium]